MSNSSARPESLGEYLAHLPLSDEQRAELASCTSFSELHQRLAANPAANATEAGSALDSDEEAKEFIPFHDAVALVAVIIFSSLVLPEMVLFFQLGDGDILFVNGDGPELITIPDDELWGNLTRSLCQQDASAWAQVRCVAVDEDVDPRMVVLSTDGVRDCLGESYETVGKRLQTLIDDKGWETMVDDMPEWLADLSERGNGDDATLALVAFEADDDYDDYDYDDDVEDSWEE